MIEIRSILAPTDFSEHAEVALRYACGLAERFGAALHLLHVLPDIIPTGPDVMLAPALPPEFYDKTEAESREALLKVLDPAWGRPVSVATSVLWGGAVDRMVEYATFHNIDLIVVATHGRSGLSHALLGSLAEAIMRQAPCPVLSIRDRST